MSSYFDLLLKHKWDEDRWVQEVDDLLMLLRSWKHRFEYPCLSLCHTYFIMESILAQLDVDSQNWTTTTNFMAVVSNNDLWDLAQLHSRLSNDPYLLSLLLQPTEPASCFRKEWIGLTHFSFSTFLSHARGPASLLILSIIVSPISRFLQSSPNSSEGPPLLKSRTKCRIAHNHPELNK